jgi:hypothetical protein
MYRVDRIELAATELVAAAMMLALLLLPAVAAAASEADVATVANVTLKYLSGGIDAVRAAASATLRRAHGIHAH